MLIHFHLSLDPPSIVHHHVMPYIFESQVYTYAIDSSLNKAVPNLDSGLHCVLDSGVLDNRQEFQLPRVKGHLCISQQ